VKRATDGRRYLAEIAVLEAGGDGLVRACAAASFDESGRLRREPSFARLERLVA